MDILVAETNEVVSLRVTSDPTDSMIANYTHGDEFKQLPPDCDQIADFAMSKDDADWWSNAIDNINLADHLENELAAVYGGGNVDEVIDRYYQSNEIGEDGANKIGALCGYFKNQGTTYHKLTKIDSAKETKISACEDGSYNFLYVNVTVSDVLTPVVNKSGWFDGDYELKDITIALSGVYKPHAKNYDDFYLVEEMATVELDDSYAENAMSCDRFCKYVTDLALVSNKEEGDKSVGFWDALAQVLDKEIAKI